MMRFAFKTSAATASTFGLLLLAAPLLAVWAGGCTTKTEPLPAEAADATTEDGGVEADGTTPSTCEATLGGECGDCMKSSCCDALSACEGDADCLACVSAKDSDACEKTPETHERVDAYLTCKGGACKASCVSDAGGSCSGLLGSSVSSACATCLEASCCAEVAACNGHAVCWDGCLNNHDEAKCHGDPDGHALYHAMGACSTKMCATACN